MNSGLKININGVIEEVYYNGLSDLLSNSLYERTHYKCLEIFELNEGEMLIYTSENLIDPFNNFDLQNTIARGDIFIIRLDMDNEFVDIHKNEFINLYQVEDDLDATIIPDEMEIINLDRDEYDYTDDFIVDDRHSILDDYDSDCLDFIDYEQPNTDYYRN